MSTTAEPVHRVRDELAHLIVPLDSLHEHPRNPRRGQLEPIAESLTQHGQYRPLIAQLDGTVIAGNHTLAAARLLGWTHVAATLLDVDDERAERIMLVDNRTSDLGTYDDVELAALLDELNASTTGLDGTGYSSDDLAELLAALDADTPSVVDDDVEQPRPDSFGVYARDTIAAQVLDDYRAAGFPYPRPMPRHRAMIELNALAALNDDELLTSRLGLAVADGYHPHRFAVQCGTQPSPLDAFNDDKRMAACIARMLDDGIGFAEGTFRANISLTRGAQPASNFRPGYALAIMRRYGAHASSWLDCSTGFGGRLVGFMASHLVRYVGIDPNTLTDAANRQLVDELCPPGKTVQLICSPAEDVVDVGMCDVAFTSPPYFAKERYSDEDTQSWKRYPTLDEWRDGFLRPVLELQHRSLVDGAYNIVNIADVTIGGHEHGLVELTCDVARTCGFDVERLDELRLTHRYGAGHDTSVHTEPVIVLRRVP